jgi:hypothetical protein
LARGEFALAEGGFASDDSHHGGLIPAQVPGPAGRTSSVVRYRSACSTLRGSIVDLLVQGAMIARRWTAHGPSRRNGVNDERPGEPQPDTLSGMTFARLNAGAIQESWLCWEARDGQAQVFKQDVRAWRQRPAGL